MLYNSILILDCEPHGFGIEVHSIGVAHSLQDLFVVVQPLVIERWDEIPESNLLIQFGVTDVCNRIENKLDSAEAHKLGRDRDNDLMCSSESDRRQDAKRWR